MTTRKILIIDDEIDIVDVIAAYAREFGFEADLSINGVDAIEKAMVNDYYAIFCDYKMPGLDGLAIYKIIISRKPTVKGRFIMITGAILDKDVKDILRKEEIPLLKKPFRFKDVTNLLSSLEGM